MLLGDTLGQPEQRFERTSQGPSDLALSAARSDQDHVVVRRAPVGVSNADFCVYNPMGDASWPAPSAIDVD